jgi:hypothetical protein
MVSRLFASLIAVYALLLRLIIPCLMAATPITTTGRYRRTTRTGLRFRLRGETLQSYGPVRVRDVVHLVGR